MLPDRANVPFPDLGGFPSVPCNVAKISSDREERCLHVLPRPKDQLRELAAAPALIIHIEFCSVEEVINELVVHDLPIEEPDAREQPLCCSRDLPALGLDIDIFNCRVFWLGSYF